VLYGTSTIGGVMFNFDFRIRCFDTLSLGRNLVRSTYLGTLTLYVPITKG
jgi:hypothetical protein